VIGVLIVDDHPALRAGLEQMLEASGELTVVGSAAGGREGVTLAAASAPDVVLMDLEMPGLDGAAATREILELNTGAKVVVLTSFGDRARILEALDAGAIGYLLKDAEPDDLVRAVKAAAAGDAPLDPRAAREILADQRARPAAPDLSEREREILALVAHGHANKVIALRLGISHKTVRNTLSAACRKIGATDRTQAALWAQRHGLA
jgi:DNA-binding NarL/FixJ family response regulator